MKFFLHEESFFKLSKTSHRKFGGVILTDRVEDGSPEVPKLVLKYGMMIV
ncbi:hypothetical protein [Klebsiella phage Kpn02]|uniref:Uncharacterized protein n=1 Tax=Klebsiella phage Kpn02 TaxID=3044023 RepID=A0AAT9V6B0_9CAUD|nr:hypothetical protein [Klebsiella phage Kpn02]